MVRAAVPRMLRGVSDSAARPTFSILGFPVRVTPFFFLIVLFLGAPAGDEWDERVLGKLAIWFGAVFVAVLLHELGHALVMRRYGYAPSIVLHGLGGHTTWGRGPARPTPRQRVLVSLAGPFAGIAIGIAPFLLDVIYEYQPGHWALQELLFLGWFTTFGWGVLNLVPMLPWDGGHVVESAVDHFAEGRGTKVAAVVTFAVAAAIITLVWLGPVGGIGPLWITLLCLLSASTAYRALKPPRRADPRHVAPAAALTQARQALEQAGEPERLVAAVLLGSGAGAWADLADDLEQAVAPRADSPAERASALELAGWARLLAGDPAGADRAIASMRPSHDPSPMLEALVAVRSGRFDEAIAAAEEMELEEERRPRRRILAYALAADGRVDEAARVVGDDRESGALVDASLFHAERFDAAAALGEALFGRFENPEDAYNAACSHARAGRAAEGLRWLERAIDAGYDDVAHLEGDDDLAAVRALDGYAPLRARLR